MKATVNGIELEGTPTEIQQYISALDNNSENSQKVQKAQKNQNEPWLDELLESLTRSQRETYYLITATNRSRTGTHISHIADELNITPEAASQRCGKLVQMGLIERVKAGRFRRT